MIIWEKHGLLETDTLPGYSHASHPTAIKLDDQKYLLAYCGRDDRQYSHIFFRTFQIINGKIELNDDTALALRPGNPGLFDSHGVLSCNFVKDREHLFLYYCGWLNLADGLWHCDTGRAEIDQKTLLASKQFLGPIMGRSRDIPLYAVATTVIKEEDKWIAWYNRGLSWDNRDGELVPNYGIHYAQSANGVDWDCEDKLVIPFLDDHEHSFGRPTVIKLFEHYLMWFSARGANGDPEYKIGFAISRDGKKWKRLDDFSGINPSGQGWDSEAVCYPSVFEHGEQFFMLYNGNQYGRTGFGYASTDKKKLPSLLDTLTQN